MSLPIGSVRAGQLSHEFPHMRRDTHCNVIGPVVQRLRKQRGWSQAKLAEHLQSAGWNISRSGLAKIECRVVWVGDFELLYFVNVFGLGIGELFPRISKKAPVQTMIAKHLGSAGDCGGEHHAV